MSSPDSAPDYATFTLEELLDARDHVDHNLYPGRASEIARWISRRRAGEAPVREARGTATPPADPNDPYRPPAAPLELPAAEPTGSLARRGLRMAAAVAEGVIAAIPQFVVLGVTGAFTDPSALSPGGPAFVLNWLISFFFLAVNIVFWSRHAQSIGKRIVGLRITDRAGRPAGMRRILARQLPTWVLGIGSGLVALPTVNAAFACFAILDVLFIFGPARRCLHDYWAGTIVTTASPENDPSLVARG